MSATQAFERGQNERPDYCTDEHLEYLDDLREAGIVNMFGARPYLMDAFGLSGDEAAAVLGYWMVSFGERHPA